MDMAGKHRVHSVRGTRLVIGSISVVGIAFFFALGMILSANWLGESKARSQSGLNVASGESHTAGSGGLPTISSSSTAVPKASGESEDADPHRGPAVAPSAENTSSQGLRTVEVVMVSAGDDGSGSVTASAVVPGLVDQVGTCTLVLAREGQVVAVSGPATSAPTSMNCAADLAIAKSDLEPGDWEGRISYQSSTSTGTSSSMSFKVDR